MVNPPWVHLGGVGAGDVWGARSLIITPSAFLLTTLCFFFEGGRVAATLRLSARVPEDPAFWPFNESLADSPLEVQAETGTARIGDSPS
jgi:hypothetical protein